jgi:hypothetical protein
VEIAQVIFFQNKNKIVFVKTGAKDQPTIVTEEVSSF